MAVSDDDVTVEFDGLRVSFLHAEATRELKVIAHSREKMLPSRPNVLEDIELPSRSSLTALENLDHMRILQVEAAIRQQDLAAVAEAKRATKRQTAELLEQKYVTYKLKVQRGKVKPSVKFRIASAIPESLQSTTVAMKLKRRVVGAPRVKPPARVPAGLGRTPSARSQLTAQSQSATAGETSASAVSGVDRTRQGEQAGVDAVSRANRRHLTGTQARKPAAKLARDCSASEIPMRRLKRPMLKSAVGTRAQPTRQHVAMEKDSTECSEFTEVDDDSADELNASDASDASGGSDVQTDISELTENSEASSDEMDEYWDGALGVA
jgi:hypothetical protein